VKPQFLRRCLVLPTATIFLLLIGLFHLQAKEIHLRNELIQPAHKSQAIANAALAATTSSPGLLLVQFEGPLSVENRRQLAELGVSLLRYVPDDTFVVRLQGSSAEAVKSLSYVSWVGAYKPEHKIHANLSARSKVSSASSQPSEPLGVSVLLVPRPTSAEIQSVRNLMASVQQESTLRSGSVIRGRVDPGQLDSLIQSETVLWVEPAPRMKLVDEVSSKLVAGDGGPNKLLAQSLGYDGRGVAVAVADSGLDNGDAASMHPDLLGRTPTFFYYGSLTDAADEHSHGTHVSGIVAGNGATGEMDENGALYGLGVAPGASIIAQRIFDGLGGYEAPPSYEKLTRDATRAGAVIGSNSWGDDTQGRYDISAMEFDELVRDADALTLGDQQYVLEFSAGNAGPGSRTIGSPAVGKNVIATGASENDRLDLFIYADGTDTMADFSSRGPCEDGRIKPDVVAPGTWIASLQSASATDQFAWSPIDDYYQYQGGTSQAGPHAAGAAAVFVQYYRETHGNNTPSPALVKAALINTARDLDDAFGTGPVPNMDEGWGALDLPVLFDPERTCIFIDQTSLLTNGQVFERQVLIANPDQPLKITLTYTDEPGFPGAIPALVNDLDLELVGPDGTVYRGNQFQNGESIPNAAAGDRVNNVEAVHLARPRSGQYTVRVRGFKIVQDAREDTPAIDQDFALVISGAEAKHGTGYIYMDRSAYTAPDAIYLTVVDTDLAGNTSASVTVKSSSETSAEAITLASASPLGVFTGVVATAIGPAVQDGRLQVTHGDSIDATYLDQSASQNRFASAHSDLMPPVLSNVADQSSFGTTRITWATDEPATSIVRVGPDRLPSSFTQSYTNLDLVSAHSVSVSDLIPGRTYYYFVVSEDEAHNSATNNNNGNFYSVIVATNAPILLVDEYQDTLGLGVPPLSGYTDALNGVGLAYDIWDAAGPGAPPLATLQAYRAVIYRVPELEGAWAPEERSAVSNYLSSGGSVFLSSMEVLSRLTEASGADFIQNVLQVQSFLTDETGSAGAPVALGLPWDRIGSGLQFNNDYSAYEEAWSFLIEFGGLPSADLSDAITPTTNAVPIFQNDSDQIIGLRWQGSSPDSGRLVFLSFPLDAVPLNGGANDRINLLRNALTFLIPAAPGLGTLTLDSPSYTVPARANLELGDTTAAGSGQISLKITSTSDADGILVTLPETARKGLFTGTFDTVEVSAPLASGKLRAKNDDTIRVAYTNEVSGLTLTASAIVDTVPASITNVRAETDYIEATIFWETSEPTDALVQYGESPLLGRTAYDSTPTIYHGVTLPMLAPDRTYYYQVSSRDLAGNTVTDDNSGKLYTFRTLPPLLPPWTDNMDQGATNWTVYDSDGSQSGWTLGIPNNAGLTGAHSPPDAWGSNLNGDSVDFQETFLISPALYLTNGNTATLNFWHYYDFTDLSGSGFDIELGSVEIVANNAPAVELAQFGDASGDWTQKHIDLSRYMGQVVYVVWHYVLFSLESLPRPGWLVDDVSITVSNVQTGTVEITNNIPEASFVLSGPAYLKSKGTGLVITNAPPGQYILEFADVPWYLTPAPQTNQLSPGGMIRFTGYYLAQDTDKDGVPDGAEIIAGTDPNNPQSVLVLDATPQSSGTLNLTWDGVAGRSYRLVTSSDAVHWIPASEWLPASSNSAMSIDVPLPTGTGPQLFRLEVIKP
jgi:hypothetical protein